MKARGDSGVDMTQAIDDKVTIVGSNPNVFPSCRKDGAGRERKIVTTSATQGTIESTMAYTECEAVDNAGDHHGGTYSMVAMNRFSIDSGGGGINLNSGGNVNLMAAGGLANIVASECSSIISNVIKVVSSEIVVIKGPELYVESDNTTFVNSVKMSKNLVVQGGAFVNGELFINHMTAPQQIMDTSMSPVLPVFFNTPTILTGTAQLIPTCAPVVGEISGAAMPFMPSVYVQFTLDPLTTTQALGRVLPHKHTYKHAACTFAESQSNVWAEASATDSNEAVAAKKPESFGGEQSVMSKIQKRVTNAFTDCMSSLFGGMF
jgi:hypothetical protein